MRRRVKAFIDVVGQRGGQALASIMILLLALVDGHLVLGGLLAILVTAWIATAGGLKRHYLDLFRGTLNEELVQTRIDFPALDMGSLESMIAALNSTNDAEVIAALELLAAEKKVRVIPTLILYHPSDEVKIKALEIFARAGRREFLDLSDRLAEGASPPVQAAILRARSSLQPDEQLLRQHLDVDCPVVSGTALVSLIAADWMDEEETATALTTRIEDGSKETRVALARAIAYQPSPAFVDPLLRLADSSDRELRLEVAKAMKAVRSPRFLPALLSMLTERDLRPAAREAVVALGERVLGDLDEALRDAEQPLRVRRHLPRTISRFGSQRAARILLDRLPTEPDGMTRYKILRGLAQLRRLDAEIELDPSILDLAIEQTVRRAFQLLDWRDQLSNGSEGHPERSTPVQDLLLQLLRDKKHHAVERLFTLLGLRFVDEDFAQIYRGLLSASREARSSSRELLENRLAPPLREAVIGLIERDASLPERLEQAGQFHRRQDLDYSGVLRDLIESQSESIRSLAVYHVGELGLSGLKPHIEALEPAPQSYLSAVVERVVSLLPAARRGKLAFES
jgi:AAA family ATP:ADP antiporter